MDTEQRQKIEREIAEQFVKDALAAGFSITVDDGEDFPIEKSEDADEILAAMFSTDEETLVVYQGDRKMGSAYFVYGNDGWDVIADSSLSLEPLMVGADAIAAQYEDQA